MGDKGRSMIWTGVGILIFLMLVGYFLAYNFFGIRSLIGRGIEEIQEKKEIAEIKLNTLECPKEIIPETISVIEKGSWYGGEVYLAYITEWKDRTPIKYEMYNVKTNVDYGGVHCPKGSETGQNINYHYCKSLSYEPETKTIDEEGNIMEREVKEYIINLILKEIPEEKWTIYDSFKGGINWGNYSIVSATCIRK